LKIGFRQFASGLALSSLVRSKQVRITAARITQCPELTRSPHTKFAKIPTAGPPVNLPNIFVRAPAKIAHEQTAAWPALQAARLGTRLFSTGIIRTSACFTFGNAQQSNDIREQWNTKRCLIFRDPAKLRPWSHAKKFGAINK